MPIRSHIEMAHILGLGKNPFDPGINRGWWSHKAQKSSRARFAQLHAKDLALYLLRDYSQDSFYNAIQNQQHGGFDAAHLQSI